MENKFADCETLEEVLYQLAGYSSVCWDENQVLDEEALNLGVNDARDRILELSW